MTIETQLLEELGQLQTKDLYRDLKVLKPLSSTKAFYYDKELTLFCANDYLGLSHNPAVIDAAKQSLKEYGVGAGAARLISGTTVMHRALEKAIALNKNKEKALVFSAGYLANLGVLTAIAEEDDLIILDKLCHASLIDAAKLSGATVRVFPHKNYKKCEEIIKKNNSDKRIILVTDTVFSMDGDLADLEECIRLKKEYGCFLIVDDAHGTGVLGVNGGGALEDKKLENEVDVITGTLSKAIGCVGGFAAASDEIIKFLINKARPFIFATALPPLICAAALESLRLIETAAEIRFQLWKNIQILHNGIKEKGFNMGEINSPILPLILGDEKTALLAYNTLLERGFFVPAVRYPSVSKGKARLRVTVSSTHTQKDIDRFLAALSGLTDKP